MNVLVSSAGRRGHLIELIRATVAPLGGQVVAMDAGPWSAACRLADDWRQVSSCKQKEFASELLDYCVEKNVRLVIPTIDTELPVLSQLRPSFLEAGVSLAVSGIEAVKIADDKAATASFLRGARLPTVVHIPDEQIERDGLRFPVVIKPRFGSASSDVQIVHDLTEYEFFRGRIPNPIVQELATGREFTVNFYVDRTGTCRAAIPHWRIETRGGEVSKCATVRHEKLIAVAAQIAQQLPDAWGPMCYQAFIDDVGGIKIIEINARFGGGYPIAHQAGANFIEMLIRDLSEQPIRSIDNWQDGLVMTRWDNAVFTKMSHVQERAA